MTRTGLLALVVGLAVAATLPGGGRMFAAAVLLWCAVMLVQLSDLLAAGGRRPVVPAAAVAALGAPIGLLLAGEQTWDRVPMLMAAMLLAAFVLALAAPRKTDVTLTLAATVLPAVLLGLGAAGVLVLRSAAAGFRWTVGLLLLTAAPVGVGAVAQRLAGAPAQTSARVVSAGAIGGALLLAADPPFGPVVTVVLTVVGLAAGWAAAAVTAVLVAAEAPDDGQRPRGVAALATMTAPMVAAPIAAFLALATQV